MANKTRIDQYRREDALAQVKTVYIGHLILGVIALAGNNFLTSASPHGVYCLLTAAAVFGADRLYAWDKPVLNWVLAGIYLFFAGTEFFQYGLPASVLEFAGGYSKGAMLDGIMYLVPFVYTALRFLLVLPLIAVAGTSASGLIHKSK